MSFNSLEIRKFRGLESLTLTDFKQVNLIAGCNNSGKSSVLEALFLLTGITDAGLNIRINQFRDYSVRNTDDLKLIFFNLDTTTPIYLKSVTQAESYREMTVSAILNKREGSIPLQNLPIEETSVVNTTTNASPSILGLNLDFTIKEKHKPAFKNATQLFAEKEGFRVDRKFNYSETLRAAFINSKFAFNTVVDRLDKIINDKQEDELIDVLSKIEPKIQRISIGANRVIKVDTGLESLVPVNIMGDGIRKLLTILTAIYEVKDGILLIDEIENGLHYSTLKTLWKAIIHAAKKFNVQIFVTTHNYEVLKYLRELISEEIPDFSSNVMHYTIQKLPDGTVKSYKYDFEHFDYALSQGLEIRS